MRVKSPSERRIPYLVPRYVDHLDKNDWHICMADYRFAHGAIVTLEAVCGAWCFGTLSRQSPGVLRYTVPDVHFCHACAVEFLHRRAELDPALLFWIGGYDGS